VSAHFFYCSAPIKPGVILLGKTKELEELIEKELSRVDIELVAVEYRTENREQILRVFIDSEAGVDLNLCTQATRAVKPFLDENDIYYDHFEVSSPGLDRVLRKDKDFLRFRGSRVKIKMLKHYDGPGKINGILMGADDKNIQVQLDEKIIDLPRDLVLIVRLHPDY
jgi:ribosome maturation factor RimP